MPRIGARFDFRRSGIATCVAFLVAACDASGTLGRLLQPEAGPGPGAEVGLPKPGFASLTLSIAITPGGLQAQTVVTAFTRASIDHLVIKAFKVSGEAESPVLAGNDQVGADIPGSDLDKTLTLSRLPANTALRFRAYAYKAPGQAETDLISTADSTSYTDLTLGSDDRPALASLKVRLVDVLFDGQVAPRGVVVTEGGYATTPATISF